MPVRRYQLLPHAKQVIRDRDFKMLAQIVRDWSPSDLAELVESLPAADQVLALRHLSRPQAVAAFKYLIPTAQQRLLKRHANYEAAEM